ncbi:MAG: N-6 DNA methylase [Acidilobus sp.]|nr:N-6 DNA methylase [Acidilobus sp.]
MSSGAQLNSQLNIDEVTNCIRSAVNQASTEDDVKVRVSACIEEKILKPLGISQVGHYNVTLVSGVRPDALYGHVIIEYKAPGKLSNQSEIQKAKEQVIKYIKDEAQDQSAWDRYLGVIISDKIAFVRYDKRNDTWILRGPYDIRRESVIKLIEALRGLSRKSLSVDNIVKDFGPSSQIAKRAVKLLYERLLNARSERTKLLFSDWKRLFSQATGYDPSKLKELRELMAEYGLANANPDALIFAIHTYYALIMKLIAAEVAYLYGGGIFYRSYVAELEDKYTESGIDGVKATLSELESGGVFVESLHIENFLEDDYFSWYLEEMDKDLADVIAEVARTLSTYEIATPQLEPEFARDLLKRLYQNLVPRDIRHNLGEYYTPDWLAELMLDEVGLSLENLMKMGEEDPLKPLNIRVLDPACGSGTFLVLYISRLRRYAEEHYLVDVLPKYILENVVGYDLNPLAVLTARTNYLLAIADLLQYVPGSIEIPIYLADSIMVEMKSEVITGPVYLLRTAAGEFRVPIGVAQDANLLRKILDEARMCLKIKCEPSIFEQRLKSYKLDPNDINILLELYNKLLDLERQGKDRVWISVLRNAFAPMLEGKFDFVVGNPPWVNWGNLPEQYRDVSKDLWTKYKLAEIRGKRGLGKVNRDLSMLFLARSFDRYLREGGKLGFLITFTVFKTQAGAGFRGFLARNTKIHVIHNLVKLMPFEGAINTTGAIVVEKVCDLEKINSGECKVITEVQKANMGGIKHVVWNGKRVDPDALLEEVIKTTRRYEIVMKPIMPNDPSSPWMPIITHNIVNAVRKVISGGQHYEAHTGVYVGLNQVYFVRVRERTPDGMLIVTNPPEGGEKKEVKQVEAKVEPDLVYPLIRGEDVERWYVDYKNRYIIIPHNPRTASPIPEADMKVRWPLTYSYLVNYRRELENRSIHKLWGRGNPFYAVYDIGTYTFAPYKVVWKEITGSFACAVVEPIDEKPVVPDHKLMLVEAESPDEAYYIAGVLNSVIARSIIESYTCVTERETHILDVIKVPKFNPNTNLHKKIAELSRRAHELARCIYASSKPSYCAGINAENELRKVEDEIDKAVAELYGISESELKEFRRQMAILSGEESPVEDEIKVPENPDVNVPGTLLRPGVESYIEVDVTNPSGEELEITYELPWGKGSFRITEGKHRINAPPLNPGKYKGVLRWTWRGVEYTKEFEVEVSEPMGPKRPRTLLKP